MVKRTGGAQNIGKVIAHCRYVGFRSREIQNCPRGFFDANRDNFTDYKTFTKGIENNKALKHPSSNKIHKFVFSLTATDYKAYQKSGKDFKDLTRETMERIEERLGVKIDWIASFHDSPTHPHSHVIAKAVSAVPDKDGKYTRLRFGKEDFKMMRECMNNAFEKDVVRDHDYDLNLVKDIVHGLGYGLGHAINRDLKKREAQNERDKQKEIEKRKGRSR